MPKTDDVWPTLTGREMEILGLLAGGRSNGQIAAETGLSVETVKWYVAQLLSKLGMESRSEAGDWWRARHGVQRRRWQEEVEGPAWEPLVSKRIEREEGRMNGPVLVATGSEAGFEISGGTLAIEEWRGSAPGELHVHHVHDIAWHVLDGSLRFRFEGGEISVPAGSTLFVPAGTVHSYGEGDSARYLVIGHPRLFALFRALRTARTGRPHTDWGNGPDAAIYREYESELVGARTTD